MSDEIFETQEMLVINDCRKLNYLELMGLLNDAIIFNKIEQPLFSASGFNVHFFKNFIQRYVSSYVLHCNPEEKSSILTFKDKNDLDFMVKFVPKGIDGIRIDIIDTDGYRIGTIKYSIDELMDLFI